MSTARGGRGWSPAAFWSATRPELDAAIAGWIDAHGGNAAEPLGRDELEDLMRAYPDVKTEKR